MLFTITDKPLSCLMVMTIHQGVVISNDNSLDTLSTKDSTHKRRRGGSVGLAVHFNDTVTLQTKKEDFLSNTQNKQRYIDMLMGNKLETAGCKVHHAHGDDDLLVVESRRL